MVAMVEIMASMSAETRDPKELPESRFCDPRLRISCSSKLSSKCQIQEREYKDECNRLVGT